MPEETETQEAERVYLNSLRNLVQAQLNALEGLVTRDKQRALSSAQNLSNLAQRDLLTQYMKDLRFQASTPTEDEAEAPHDSAGEEYTDLA